MANLTCPLIAQEDDSELILSTYNTSLGARVLIGCRRFAHRYKGAYDLTCNQTQNGFYWLDDQSRQVTPSISYCEWTGVLNTYEKIVLGVAAGAASFLVICLVSIICLGCLKMHNDKSRKRHKKKRKPKDKSSYQNFDSSLGHHDDYRRDSGDYARPSGPYSDRMYNAPSSGVYASRIQQDSSTLPYQDRPTTARQSGTYEDRINRSDYYYQNQYDINGRHQQHYDNRAYSGNDVRYQQPSINRENYRWNGQIPRPHIGANHREDSHVF